MHCCSVASSLPYLISRTSSHSVLNVVGAFPPTFYLGILKLGALMNRLHLILIENTCLSSILRLKEWDNRPGERMLLDCLGENYPSDTALNHVRTIPLIFQIGSYRVISSGGCGGGGCGM
jgi:hypothetical protein